MAKIVSQDYHDYVIKDGKLIGEFEQMYANAATIPWHQDEQDNWIDVLLTITLLRAKRSFSRVVDYGCGTGHYLDILVRNLNINYGVGFDVSVTASKKAKESFPDLTFRTADLMVEDTDQFLVDVIDGNTLHIIRGTLWYIFPQMKVVVNNIFAQVEQRDSLVVVQNFPPLDSKFVGKEVIPDSKALVKHFTDQGFELENHIWYEQHQNNNNDSWFIGLFKKNNI